MVFMNEPFYSMNEHDSKTIGIKFSGGAPVNESTKKLYGYLFHLNSYISTVYSSKYCYQ
jgi:hypothetical protein